MMRPARGVLLVFGAPCQLPLLAGPEHGRTIPLAVMDIRTRIPQLAWLSHDVARLVEHLVPESAFLLRSASASVSEAAESATRIRRRSTLSSFGEAVVNAPVTAS